LTGKVYLRDGQGNVLMKLDNFKDSKELNFVPKYFAIRSGVDSEAEWKVLEEIPKGR